MSAKFAYAQWPWGTETKEAFIQSCKDLSEVGFEYFENGGDKVEVGDFGYYMKKVKL